MRFFASTLALLATFVTTVTAVALTPNQVPQFETLFYAELVLGPFDTFPGTFGTRINVQLLPEGSFRDPSGNPIADLLGGSVDGGLVSDSKGLFFPDMKMALRWHSDQKLASFQINGVGKLHQSSLFYAHVETDSEEHAALNGQFIMGNITFPPTGNPTITFFGAI